MAGSHGELNVNGQSETAAPAQPREGWPNLLRALARVRYRQWVVYFALLIMCVGFAFAAPNFLTGSNFANIGRQTAIVSVVAFAMTFAFTAGEFDLSVGSAIALSGMLAAMTLRAGGGVGLATLVALATGTAGGLFNAVLVTKAKIPSFLVTLGYLSIARGIALTITKTESVVYDNPAFDRFWGGADLGMIPGIVIWTVVALIFFYVLFNRTVFGRYAQATGGNQTAARFSGINASQIKFLCLAMTGAAAGVGGLLMLARLGVGRPYVAQGMELDIIAAVILGGTSLFGGKGTIVGTLIGALLIGVVNNGLILIGLGAPEQMIVKGAIIVAAVLFGEKGG